jgi:hypothetical protein
MIINRALFSLISSLSLIISGCKDHSKEQSSSSASITNDMNEEARQYLESNSQARNYFESFMPEIERNEKVDQAIKAAIATSGDPRVQAFRQFLSHWHLQWPVVKEGAVGEGGIGFAWYKDLQKFQGGVDATAIIEDRYTLQIILDCNVSPDYNIVEFTNLRFSFGEVKAVRPQPGGGCDIRYNSANGRQFGLKEWNQLKAANWDFSSIGINIISNAPIPNIHQAFD